MKELLIRIQIRRKQMNAWLYERMRVIAGTSVTIAVLDKMDAKINAARFWIPVIYKDSAAYKAWNKMCAGLKIGLKNSSLNRLAQARLDDNFIRGSKLVNIFINFYKTCGFPLVIYAKQSRSLSLLREEGSFFARAPLKAAGFIFSAAILTDIFLALSFSQRISLFGWMLRACFLIISIGAVFSTATFGTMKKSSRFLKGRIV